MSLHANLRDIDRRRTTQALTAWTCDDQPALDAVLAEANNDLDAGVAGLLFGLLQYADWLANNTGPPTTPPPGHQDQP